MTRKKTLNLHSENWTDHRLRRFHRFYDLDAGRTLECSHRRVASSLLFQCSSNLCYPRSLWFL